MVNNINRAVSSVGIAKIKYPKFEDVARRYIEEISINKKCYKDDKSQASIQ